MADGRESIDEAPQPHTVTVTFEDGMPSYTLQCTAPAESICRAVWACSCDMFFETCVRNGLPAHMPDYHDADTWHAGEFGGECCLYAWFDGAEEALHGSVTFPVEAEFDYDSVAFHVVPPAPAERRAILAQSHPRKSGKTSAFVERLTAEGITVVEVPTPVVTAEQVADGARAVDSYYSQGGHVTSRDSFLAALDAAGIAVEVDRG